jgi:hypothetical protein
MRAGESAGSAKPLAPFSEVRSSQKRHMDAADLLDEASDLIEGAVHEG